jgi:muramoyltetrapeptide carboxypeptidase
MPPQAPPRLRAGNTLRVIAPSRSLAIISSEVRDQADCRLREMGFGLTFGKHVDEIDKFLSTSVSARLEDFHDAFADPSVDGILTAIGGYNCNQLISGIDYDLVRRNRKVFCGFSDVTALQNAMFAQSEVMSYSGPHYSTFGMMLGLEYSIASFLGCVTDSQPLRTKPSLEWSDDEWYVDQQNRKFIENPGPRVIAEGVGEGPVVGGNLCTLNLLQGTPYMPSLAGVLLFLEDDQLSEPEEFDRDLQSLMHLPDFPKIRGLAIGRFQAKSRLDASTLSSLIRAKIEFPPVPIVSDLDFGHTTPMLTLPVGGTARLEASGRNVQLSFLSH